MEIQKIDEQIKLLQEKKRAALKKEKEQKLKEIVTKLLGNNWQKFYEQVKAAEHTEVYIDGQNIGR